MPPDVSEDRHEMMRRSASGLTAKSAGEFRGSTAKASKEKEFDMALPAPSTERPPKFSECRPKLKLATMILFTPTRTAKLMRWATQSSGPPWLPSAVKTSCCCTNTQKLGLSACCRSRKGRACAKVQSQWRDCCCAAAGLLEASGRVVVGNIRKRVQRDYEDRVTSWTKCWR